MCWFQRERGRRKRKGKKLRILGFMKLKELHNNCSIINWFHKLIYLNVIILKSSEFNSIRWKTASGFSFPFLSFPFPSYHLLFFPFLSLDTDNTNKQLGLLYYLRWISFFSIKWLHIVAYKPSNINFMMYKIRIILNSSSHSFFLWCLMVFGWREDQINTKVGK